MIPYGTIRYLVVTEDFRWIAYVEDNFKTIQTKTP